MGTVNATNRCVKSGMSKVCGYDASRVPDVTAMAVQPGFRSWRLCFPYTSSSLSSPRRQATFFVIVVSRFNLYLSSPDALVPFSPIYNGLPGAGYKPERKTPKFGCVNLDKPSRHGASEMRRRGVDHQTSNHSAENSGLISPARWKRRRCDLPAARQQRSH